MEREALKLALEVNESMKDVLKQVNELIAENKALKEALAQPAQEPVAGTKTWFEDGKVVTQYLTAKDIYKEPAQEPAIGDIRALKHRIHELEGEVIGYKRILDAQPAQERNFCPRCGKRTWDIHTCTAPLENT